MSSTARAFAVLGLFSKTRSIWHTDDIIASLGYSRASGYRYVKELVDAGFLQKVAAGRYALGPRIVELDYQLRQTDPVLLAAVPIMNALAQRTRLNVVLSALFGRDRVVDTHYARVGNGVNLGYGRGHLRPLLQGAAPKVLVAALPRAALKRLYERRAAEISAAQLGQNWHEFRRRMSDIREARFYLSKGEVERHVGAAAVPILNQDGEVLAALALVGRVSAIRAAGEAKLRRWLTKAAGDVQSKL
jgi:DNA-binding IclR family transcriptional regulator